MNNLSPVPVSITKIIEETPSIRTFAFSEKISFEPGQFVMVWVPGIDEIPMALSSENTITVQKVGEATAVLFSLQEGDLIGIKGPLGRGFCVQGKTLAVAGGIGAAPLYPLAQRGLVDTFLLGARTRSELVFIQDLSSCTDLLVATDDGSFGHHGSVVDLLDACNPSGFDHICVCGPELMMSAVLQRLIALNSSAKSQFSLHRYMKCGIGICGSCCIDPSGSRVCREGPVFPGDMLENSEFGKYSRDASGRRRNL